MPRISAVRADMPIVKVKVPACGALLEGPGTFMMSATGLEATGAGTAGVVPGTMTGRTLAMLPAVAVGVVTV